MIKKFNLENTHTHTHTWRFELFETGYKKNKKKDLTQK